MTLSHLAVSGFRSLQNMVLPLEGLALMAVWPSTGSVTLPRLRWLRCRRG